ncbi:hypothetical protein [Streptomyces sp. NPDC005141]
MNTPKLLAHTSLAAGVVFTATAEYSLARKMGAMEPVAVMLPVAIDAYAVAALKRFRSFDITLSLLLMGAAQVSAHLLDSHVMKVNGWLVVIVSLLVPVAIWRTHALARDDDQAPAEADLLDVIQEVPTPTVERVPETPPALEGVVLAAEEPRTRVSVDVPDSDDDLLANVRTDFHGQIPTYRDLKDRYGIGQARAKRIRAVLEGELA